MSPKEEKARETPYAEYYKAQVLRRAEEQKRKNIGEVKEKKEEINGKEMAKIANFKSLYKVKDRKRHRINPYLILIMGYILLIINIILESRFYSIEWAFIGFVIVTVLYHDFKIDSRFFILPAILLLGYVPFLLIGKQDAIAETTAIYVYYFLVVGVVLQLIEYIEKIENSVDFERIMKRLIYKYSGT